MTSPICRTNNALLFLTWYLETQPCWVLFSTPAITEWQDLQQVTSDLWASRFSFVKEKAGLDDLKVLNSVRGLSEHKAFPL